MKTTAMEEWRRALLRRIPAVNVILDTERCRAATAEAPAHLVSEAVAAVLDHQRRAVLEAPDEAAVAGLDLSADALAERAAAHLAEVLQPRLRRVINATGVVLHTNLGRSLLAPQAMRQIAAVAGRYSNLELDLSTGERGSRYVHVQDLLRRLTGAEDAMVVNNNAGAVLLALSALAKGREVIVSRGELVEIGGAFRVPDVMAQGGAILREVGTTNKTHRRDYEQAIGPETALLLKVHTSNYRMIGFTASVERDELVAIGRRHNLPVMEDLGSGVLVRLERFGLPAEPTVQASVQSGIDLVTFSGDKLLGGPQAGIIVGRRELVERCRKHPLTRALRIDKLTLAALEATLRLYLDEAQALREIPTLRMLTMPLKELERGARALAAALERALGGAARVTVQEGTSQAGGGSLPGVEMPTWLVAVTPHGCSVAQCEARLREEPVPVLARVQKDQVLLDPRTLQDGEIDLICQAFRFALRLSADQVSADQRREQHAAGSAALDPHDQQGRVRVQDRS